jgi:hypothetical protein
MIYDDDDDNDDEFYKVICFVLGEKRWFNLTFK